MSGYFRGTFCLYERNEKFIDFFVLFLNFAENRGDIWLFFLCELLVFNGESKFLTVLPLNWIEVLSVPLLNIQIADILPMRTLYFLWYFRSNMFGHIWVWDWQSNDFGILPHKLGRFLLTQECTVLKMWYPYFLFMCLLLFSYFSFSFIISSYFYWCSLYGVTFWRNLLTSLKFWKNIEKNI